MLGLLLALATLAPQDTLLVTAEWLRANADRSDLVVLHADFGRAEYDRGHIPGARFADIMNIHGEHGEDQLLPPERLVAAIEAAGVSNRDRVVLVGSPMNTALLFVVLDYLGHGDRTSVLHGGLAAWTAAGGPLSTESATPAPARFEPAVRRDMVVTADWVAARLGSPDLALLDARTKAEYDGTSGAGGLSRPGHIPGARLLDWLDTLEQPAGGTGRTDEAADRLRPRPALRGLFERAGVTERSQIVTYCTVGMRASHLYFVARLLGYQPKLYLGSMADWSPREKLPVVGPQR